MANQMINMGNKKNILLGASGSVACIKLPNIIAELKAKDPLLNIKIVLTDKALHFISKQELSQMVEIYLDEHEWQMWKTRGDPVLHIDLVKWADIFVVAPLDANTLGKISSGMCDNLLTCVARAWDMDKPLIFCPAMNTKMFNHPLTRKQIAELRDFGYHEIKPVSKSLMCGDVGMGAMAEYQTIVDVTLAHLNTPHKPERR